MGLPEHDRTIAVVTIHGEFIAEHDLEQRAKLELWTPHKQSTREDLARRLAADMAKIAEAEGYGLDIPFSK